MHFHSMTKDAVREYIAMNKGKSQGKNQLFTSKKKSLCSRFLAQFSDFMILILLAAAGISFMLAVIGGEGDFIDSVIILVIVIVNAIIGVFEESRADNALEALKQMSAPTAKIRRDGKEMEIDACDVKIGDTLLLRSGDRVSADARLLKTVGMETDESALQARLCRFRRILKLSLKN